jgi:hypothetical protein
MCAVDRRTSGTESIEIIRPFLHHLPAGIESVPLVIGTNFPLVAVSELALEYITIVPLLAKNRSTGDSNCVRSKFVFVAE